MTANADQIIEAIAPLVARSGIKDVHPDTALLSSGIIDSLGVAELEELLNAAFNVTIGVENLGYDNADTPEQLAELVNDQISD